MGSFCSTSGAAVESDKDEPGPHARPHKSFGMPKNWTEKKSTRQKMEAIASDVKFESAEQYLQTVEKVIANERLVGFDGRAVANASTLENAANSIVKAIKDHDTTNIYNIQPTSDGKIRRPGDHFLGAVELINQTELLQVAKMLPKGAHLHCHFNSCLEPSFLIQHARNVPTMFIRSTRPLVDDDAKQKAEISFSVLDPATPRGSNLFNADYEPLSWMNYQDFMEVFPDGVQAVESWLDSKMRLTESEVYDVGQTGKGIWERFDVCTRMMKGLFSYESAFRAYTAECIEDFIRDNIQYAEIRPNFPSNFLVRDDGVSGIDNSGLLRIIEEEIVVAQQKTGRYFAGLKVIYCAPRSFSREKINDCLNECIELKEKFPKLVCGFDLVGPEDRGQPIRYFITELLNFRKKCDERKLDLPFLFHAGETLDTGTSTDENLFDAILLNSKRIGHGFALPKHPLALQMVKDKGIALEICPISNEILHLCPNMKGHSLPILLANNVPCTVNSDNGTFYSSTLSHDFYQVMIGSNSMSLLGWKVLCEWSIEHSCLTPSEMADVRRQWQENWTSFCQWILDTYDETGSKRLSKSRISTGS